MSHEIVLSYPPRYSCATCGESADLPVYHAKGDAENHQFATGHATTLTFADGGQWRYNGDGWTCVAEPADGAGTPERIAGVVSRVNVTWFPAAIASVEPVAGCRGVWRVVGAGDGAVFTVFDDAPVTTRTTVTGFTWWQDGRVVGNVRRGYSVFDTRNMPDAAWDRCRELHRSHAPAPAAR